MKKFTTKVQFIITKEFTAESETADRFRLDVAQSCQEMNAETLIDTFMEAVSKGFITVDIAQPVEVSTKENT